MSRDSLALVNLVVYASLITGVPTLFGMALMNVGEKKAQEKEIERKNTTIRFIEPGPDLDGNGTLDKVVIFESGYRRPLFCIEGDSKAYSAAEMKTRNPLIDYAGIEQRLNSPKKE